jgi:uncharacterized DUF497 family protein
VETDAARRGEAIFTILQLLLLKNPHSTGVVLKIGPSSLNALSTLPTFGAAPKAVPVAALKQCTRGNLCPKKYLLRSLRHAVYFPHRMDLVDDPAKSQRNKEKHGIDFHEAQALWLDEDRVEFPARSDNKERHALIALRDEKIRVAFYTMREAAIRLISVRRARENEKKAYYKC